MAAVLRILGMVVLFLTVVTACDDMWAADTDGALMNEPASLVSTVATACEGVLPLPGEASERVRRDTFDPTLFDRAVRHYSSRARCGEGGARFVTDPDLIAVATAHSRDMKDYDFFDHTSIVAGKETLGARLALESVTYRAAAENLALMSLFNFRPGVPFEVLDEEGCVFRDPDSRQIYRRRTYAELAKVLVDGWMASPGHRANLLNDRYVRIGSGLAIDPDNEFCGRVYATQNFAD